MNLKLLFKYLTWIVLVYLNIFVKTFVCHFRSQYSNSYSYGRPERHSRIDRTDYDYFALERYHSTPRNQYRPRSKSSDYDSDYRTEYRRGSPHPDRKITSFDANEGVISDAIAEEPVEDSPNMAPALRTQKDGLGKRLSAPECGTSSDLITRIVGGKDATEGAHPWIVSVLREGEDWCGGSIIAPRWILTAAHCFLTYEPDMLTWSVRLGSINRNQGRTYKIKKVIIHRRFNLDKMLNSDIALIMTSKPIEFTKNIQPVCLPDNSYDEPRESKIIVAGWGATQFGKEYRPLILQDITLTVVKDGECALKYRTKNYIIYKSQFCTWSYKKDSCQSDSGGPGVEIVNGKATLVGIVSYGKTCADDYPGVYTQVSYFLKWITRILKKYRT